MPSKTKDKDESVSERDHVVEWRYEWLRHAGWTTANAFMIAENLEIDWHLAHDMRKHCKDEELLLKVLL